MEISIIMAVYPTSIKGATDLIGGGDGAVDNIPTAGLDDLDGVIAITDNGVFFYSVDPTSAEVENSPYVIKPDDEVDDKRLILQRLVESPFESGTIYFFGQTAAPTGWTKKVDWQDNAMLCYATGAIGSGGAVNPQDAHSHGDTFSIDNHTLLTTELPSHYHSQSVCKGGGGNRDGVSGPHINCQSFNTDPRGGGGSHPHGLSGAISNNTAPYYQTVIAATKD